MHRHSRGIGLLLAVYILVVSAPWYAAQNALAAEMSNGDLATHGNGMTDRTDAISVNMNITEIGKISESFGVGENHIWIIRADIPSDIADAIHYKIVQTIDPRLDYVPFSPTVKLQLPSGEEVPLKGKSHYILTEQSVDSDGMPEKQITVSLTAEGKSYLGSLLEREGSGGELRIRYHAAINTHAEMGTQILGQAQLEYTDAAGVACCVSSEIAAVYTGGINIRKIDRESLPLAGTKYMIARAATEQECSDWSVIKEYLDMAGRTVPVIYEAFYPSSDMQGEKVYETNTDDSGMAQFYGLPYGTYYLIEMASGSDHAGVSEPLAIEINEVSHLTKVDGWKNSRNITVDNTVTIVSTNHFLPETGGSGIAIITAAGTAIVFSAAILLIMNYRKRV